MTESEISKMHDRISGNIDDGGHLIAHTLGGVKGSINIVPQYNKMNRGQYKKIETFVKKESFLIKGYTVKVDYQPWAVTFRPDNFTQSFFYYGIENSLIKLQNSVGRDFKYTKVTIMGKDFFECTYKTSNIVDNEIIEQLTNSNAA